MTTIFTIEKLYTAYNECRKGKKNSINALLFEIDREKNLLQLLEELQDRTYTISRSICFVVTRPTPREIFAASFRDRIVHHLLYNEIRELFESDFITHSYANRKGKGTHRAMYQLRKNMQKVKRKTGGGWCLKLDVQGFFRSIDKNILYELLVQKITSRNSCGGGADLEGVSRTVWQEEVLWLCKKIIFHNPTADYFYRGERKLQQLIPDSKSLFSSGCNGLPIGNLTSQFFANVYLNELDHFVYEELGYTLCVRYVDDFVIIGSDSTALRSLIPKIDTFLWERLRLHIHPKKIYLQPIHNGVDFLGYFVRSSHILVRQKVVRRFKDKLCHCINPKDGLLSVDDIPMMQSYLGHFSHANTYRLRKSLD